MDCIGDGEGVCEKEGVSALPTILYGDPFDLKEYSGGRDFDALKAFAEKELGPRCGPARVDLCDEAIQKQLKHLLGLDFTQLATEQHQAEIKEQEEIAKLNREWTVRIHRPEGTLLGIDMNLTTDTTNKDHERYMPPKPKAKKMLKYFRIMKIQKGALETFNAANAAAAVRPGDHIAKVNGVSGINAMRAEFKKNPVYILVVRSATQKAIANVTKASGVAWIKSVLAFKSARGQAANEEL